MSFLKEAHVRSGGRFYDASSPSLICAATRYETQWIPLLRNLSVQTDVGAIDLVPPLDVAWVWHIHKLKPQSYANYLKAVGEVDHNKFEGAFTWQSSPSEHSGDDDA